MKKEIQEGEGNMNKKQLEYTLQSLTMPDEMAEEMAGKIKSGTHKSGISKGFRISRYSKTAAAAIVCVMLLTVGTTAYAGYHVYQIKNLRVFFEEDISDMQIEQVGKELEQIEGVSSSRFVSSDEAWAEFQAIYFDEEMMEEEEFDKNPLIDSYNYEVAVELTANTGEIRRLIEGIEGVRKVSDLTELE